MTSRSPSRTIADLANVLATLQKNRHAYNVVTFAQLRRILERRIAALKAELRSKHGRNDTRRAA